MKNDKGKTFHIGGRVEGREAIPLNEIWEAVPLYWSGLLGGGKHGSATTLDMKKEKKKKKRLAVLPDGGTDLLLS